MTCETCTHRVETTCHRYPPQLMQGHVRIWPTIALTDSCGEWAHAVVDGVRFIGTEPRHSWWRCSGVIIGLGAGLLVSAIAMLADGCGFRMVFK